MKSILSHEMEWICRVCCRAGEYNHEKPRRTGMCRNRRDLQSADYNVPLCLSIKTKLTVRVTQLVHRCTEISNHKFVGIGLITPTISWKHPRITNDNQNNNLHPYVHLLQSGNLFVFVNRDWLETTISPIRSWGRFRSFKENRGYIFEFLANSTPLWLGEPQVFWQESLRRCGTILVPTHASDRRIGNWQPRKIDCEGCSGGTMW